jgi:hypothetical protein
LVPSGNSLAVTYPGVFGSRVGAAIKGAAPAIKLKTAQSSAAPWLVPAMFILMWRKLLMIEAYPFTDA